MLQRLLLILVIPLTMGAGPMAQAGTCGCEAITTQFDSADAAFIGTPIEIVEEVEGPAGIEQMWKLEVTEVFMGPESETISVSTGAELSNCRAEFVAGEPRGVVAVWNSGHLSTSLCGVVPVESLASAVAVTSPTTRMVAATAITASIAVIGTYVLRLRDR